MTDQTTPMPCQTKSQLSEHDASDAVAPGDTSRASRNKRMRKLKSIARYVLALFLVMAGISHLSWARTSFRAQVPDWIPFDTDAIVLASGVLEIGLGAALLGVRNKRTGWLVGAFFVAVFPGNISQFVKHRDAFGLDTDTRRAIRLLFQPLLVAWAVWSTDDSQVASSKSDLSIEEVVAPPK